MSPTEAGRTAAEAPDQWEDPRLFAAVQEYLAALEAGAKPGRQEFLARHAEVAEELAECLDGLAFVHSAAGSLAKPTTPPADMDPLLQSPLGDYRLVREIGRGGMGVVYEAVQLSLGRRVALKVLPFAAALDPKQLQRFKHEAQAAGQLHHPNIVPVYGVGAERGVHYYAMQLVDGQPLSVLIHQLRQLTGRDPAADPEAPTRTPSAADRPAPAPADAVPTPPVAAATTLLSGRSGKDARFFRSMARLVVQAAEALEHAHQLGVVHRDVKPGNLLLDARGNLWVTDFGLAQFHTDAGLTRTGDLVGTLRYMSPEQAGGGTAVLDQRTDVYSLGVTLYELLTLEPAFAGTDRQLLLRRIGADDPRPPRALDRAIPVELETIVLKAMAKEPAERYASARELADDLRRFLDDQPIRARRPTLWERGRKWSRRHKAVTVSAVVLLLMAAAVSSLTAAMLARAQAATTAALQRERVKAKEADDRATEAKASAREARAKAREASEQRVRANKSYERARDALKFLTEVCEEELAGKPHLADLRRRILETSLAYYQDFIDERKGDPTTHDELAAAQANVAAILRELSALEGLMRVTDLTALLGRAAVQEELQLHGAQRKKAKELAEELLAAPPSARREQRTLTTEEKRQRLEELTHAREKALADLLAPAKLQRLQQVELQRRGPYAFSDPAVVEALQLTDAQKDFIAAIQEESRQALFASFKRPHGPEHGRGGPRFPHKTPGWPREWSGPHSGFAPPPKKGEHKGPGSPWDSWNQRILTQLTAAQTARWREMTGEPFRGEIAPVRFGGFVGHP